MFEEHQALSAERREYPSRYTLANQGQVNQLRATAEPKWSPLSVEFAFTDIADEASKAAQPVPDVHVSFNLDQPHTEEDLVQRYNLIARAQNMGVTTQKLPAPPGHPLPKSLHEGPKGEPEPEPMAAGVAHDRPEEAAAPRQDAHEAVTHQREGER